jgi:HK97 gp10 family phage protein
MKPKVFEERMKAAAVELKSAKDALQQAALIVQRGAQANAPVRTGNLRRSITTRVQGNAAYVGTSVVYAPFVEFGTKHMPARPFLSKAGEDNKPQIEAMLAQFGAKLFVKISGGSAGGDTEGQEGDEGGDTGGDEGGEG